MDPLVRDIDTVSLKAENLGSESLFSDLFIFLILFFRKVFANLNLLATPDRGQITLSRHAQLAWQNNR
jgi:hypothetical protein